MERTGRPSPTNPDPRRIAEILVTVPGKGRDRRGSGYRVTASAVLTAAHVVADARGIVARFDADLPGEWRAACAIAWLDTESDIAVLVLETAPDTDLPPPPVGRLPDRADALKVRALGFPRWKMRRHRDGGAYRDLHQADGWIRVLSNRRSGTLELTVPPPGDDPGPDRNTSPWEGMSGAAVWAGDLVIGVVAEHYHREGLGRLSVARLDRCLTGAPAGAELARLLDVPATDAGSFILPDAAARRTLPDAGAGGAGRRTAHHSGPTGRAVTVLHLPGPRFGPDGTPRAPGGTGWGEPLLTDLTALTGDGVRVDLVVVSGGLAAHGMRDEYAHAARWLTGVAESLALARGRLVVVPGASDVNIKACAAYRMERESEGQDPVWPYWPKWRSYAAMLADFYADVAGPEFTPDRPWTMLEIPASSTVVAALNTTMADSDHHPDGSGCLGREQTRWFGERLREYRARGWLRLAVAHRLPTADGCHEDGHHHGDVQHDLLPHVNVLLHGQTATRLLPGPAGQGADTVVGAGEAAGGVYQVVAIEPARLDRRLRGYEQQTRRWSPLPVPTPTPVPPPARSGAGSLREVVTAFPTAALATGDARPARTRRLWVSYADEDADEVTRALAAVTSTLVGPDDGAVSPFVDKVRDLVPLRHDGAEVLEIVGPVGPAPAYLRVRHRQEGLVRSWPVAVCEGGVDQATVDAFTAVHQRFAAGDVHQRSELVYGGREPVGDELVARARAAGIRVMSLVEYQGLLDLRSYLRRQAARLDERDDYRPELYVPQRYRMLDESPEATRGGLLDDVVDWLSADQATFALLLADFGHGKTFLLRQLTRQLPDRLPDLVPVLVELRALEKAPSLNELLASHLVRADVKRIEPAKLRAMVHAGRIALFFDGFDELALRVSYPSAAEYLRTLLAAVAGDGSQAKVIVTSRGQHFASTDQVRSVLGDPSTPLRERVRAAVIEDFTDEQILSFLTNVYDGDRKAARSRWELLGDVRDLLGLARNPRMLAFIATLPEQRLREVRAQHGVISAADLYSELVGYWLGYETGRLRHTRGAPPLEQDERLHAVTTLALRQWTTGVHGIGVDTLTEHVAATLTRLSERGFTPEQAAHVVGSGTLLTRREDTFEFMHQSLMEWLVAAAAAAQLRESAEAARLRESADAAHGPTSVLLEAREMSPLMADFLADLAGHDLARRWATATLTAATAPADAKANALTLTDRLPAPTPTAAPGNSVPTEAYSLAGSDLRGSRLPDHLAGADLSGVVLTGEHLTGTDLSDAKLSMVDLRGAVLRLVTLARADLSGTDLRGAHLIDCDLRGTDLSGTDLRSTRLDGCDLRGAVLTGSSWRFSALLGARIDPKALDSPELAEAAVVGRDWATPTTASSEPVTSLAVTGDGTLAVAGRGSAIEIIDVGGRQVVRTIATAAGPVVAVAVAELDGRPLVVSGHDAPSEIRVWDLLTGTAYAAFGHGRGRITALAVGDLDGGPLIVAGHDGSPGAQAWTVRGAAFGTPIGAQVGQVTTMAVTELAGRTVVVTGHTGAGSGARVWDLATGRMIGDTIAAGRGGVTAMAVAAAAPHGGPILVTSHEGGGHDGGSRSIGVWLLATGEPLRIIGEVPRQVATVAMVEDGGFGIVITGHRYGGVHLWAADEPPTHLDVPHNSVTASAVATLNGRQLLLVGYSGSRAGVHMWELSGPHAGMSIIGGRNRAVRELAVGASGDRRILVAGVDRAAGVGSWDLDSGVPVGRSSAAATRTPTAMLRAVGLAEMAGRLVAACGYATPAGGIFVHDVITGEPFGTPIAGDVRMLTAMAVTRVNGQPVVVSGDSGGGAAALRVWDLATGALVGGHAARAASDTPEWITALAAAELGGRVIAAASVGDNGGLQVRDLTTGDLISAPNSLKDRWVDGVAVSELDGRLLIVTCHRDILRIWELAGVTRSRGVFRRGRRSEELRLVGEFTSGRGRTVTALALAPVDGRLTLVTGYADGAVQAWDPIKRVPTGLPVAGHTGAVVSAHLAELYGRLVLATGGRDGTVKLWTGGELSATLLPEVDGGAAVIYPDGRYKVDGDVGDRLWWAVKLHRFAPGELDPYLPGVRPADPDAPLLTPGP